MTKKLLKFEISIISPAAFIYLVDAETFDVVKALLEVWLHSLRVAGLAQDLQQVIVRQKVKARKDLPFGLQVHVQRLLNLL